MDIENFFGSINFGRVYGFFLKDNHFKLEKKIAAVIAQIACYQNALPQGSPCSPVISNLIAGILDAHLIKLAKANGCIYSRYADDITFSTNQKQFPAQVARELIPGTNKWDAGSELSRLIELAGFKLNQAKVRMQYCDSRQEVTGLVVNKKINITSEYRKTVRAMTHSALSKGEYFLKSLSITPEGALVVNRTPGTLEQLHGMLGFINSIDIYNKRHTKKNTNKEASLKDSAFKQFLIFKEFIACKQPTIICEGKTDNVYLTHAIRGLAASYPSLATITDEKKITLNVRLFKYTGTNTGKILNIYGGYQDLCKLIKSYWDMFEKYSGKSMESTNPVIILIDHDSALTPILKTIQNLTKTRLSTELPYWHIVGNLYAMPTPLFKGRTETCIEDFFDEKTRSIKLDGRVFDPSYEPDDEGTYGKADFAYEVVAKEAESIDFSLFKAILNNVDAVISEYHSKTTVVIV